MLGSCLKMKTNGWGGTRVNDVTESIKLRPRTVTGDTDGLLLGRAG